MNTLRNFTMTLLLVAGAATSAGAATGTVSHDEHDAGLRVELSATISGGLLAILLANAAVVATGFRVAKNRSRRKDTDPHDGMFDIA